MISTLIKSASSWTAACPGVSIPDGPAAYSAVSGVRQRDSRVMRDMRGLNLRDLQFAESIQDDQGRSVLEHILEAMNVPAPATAHVGVTVKGGVSGPYPWRRPV
ncbi:hypothetical protein [Actinomadura sp. 3N407]|uniref:hypothetical protein n=1 Tax=Actinomadura sp. 3N407 TaxID=3457423 RepID=UPI003FCC35B9